MLVLMLDSMLVESPSLFAGLSAGSRPRYHECVEINKQSDYEYSCLFSRYIFKPMTADMYEAVHLHVGLLDIRVNTVVIRISEPV